MRTTKGKTAAELMAELEKDPEYQDRVRRNEIERQDAEAKYREAEAPVVHDLRAAGYELSSVWDLVNTSTSYPELIPILLAHLNGDYPERVREGIARALAVRDARVGWDQLVASYLSTEDRTTHGVKWALHLAIAAAADATVLDTLIELALDRRHGHNRANFVRALARIDDPRAKAALAKLASDPDLADDVRTVLNRRRR